MPIILIAVMLVVVLVFSLFTCEGAKEIADSTVDTVEQTVEKSKKIANFVTTGHEKLSQTEEKLRQAEEKIEAVEKTSRETESWISTFLYLSGITAFLAIFFPRVRNVFYLLLFKFLKPKPRKITI